MYSGGYYESNDPAAMYAMMQRRGASGRGPPRRFDEQFRVYPIPMLAGPDRPHAVYGGKIFLPPSALEKLTRLHIEYPMLFELINGAVGKVSHAGVLEFVAEEGKVYLPQWMMDTLLLEIGDIIQIKSTSLAPARFVKIQAQSTDFLEITDPKAVLEMAFRNFGALTQGDIFQFNYNDTVYDVAVLEVKPTSEKMGVGMLETDVEVDFAPPLGYVEPTAKKVSNKGSGTSTPRSGAGLPAGGMLHSQGSMAQAINYDAIAPSSSAAVAGARAESSNFIAGGHKLNSKKGTKASTPQASTTIAGTSTTNPPPAATTVRRTNGPQPLRLAPNKLFFGYEIKPVKTEADQDRENAKAQQPHFAGQGQSLRSGVKRKGDDEKPAAEEEKKPEPSVGRRLDGRKFQSS